MIINKVEYKIMFKDINRVYKENTPTETVSKIKAILHSMNLNPAYDNKGICNPYTNVYSARLKFSDDLGGAICCAVYQKTFRRGGATWGGEPVEKA